MNRDALRQALIRDEDVRLKPYLDPLGKWTIGAGRNLTDVGISLSEAYYLLDNDIDKALRDCAQKFGPWFGELDPVRQSVLVQMAFNLGIGGLSQFTQTLAAVRRGDYKDAASLMLQSKWASQVHGRAARLAAQMETGA